MDRRTFTNTVGLGALLGSAGVKALSVSGQNGNESIKFHTVYSSKRLEPMVGTTFQCENHAGQFQMVELKRESDKDQYHLLFRNSASEEVLAEKIYLLSTAEGAQLALHMQPVETASGTHLMATINHSKG